MLKNILLLSSLTAATVGCTTHNSLKQQENLQLLQNKTWAITHIGTTEYTKQTNTPIIQFGSDLRISGSDGCNRIMGIYAVKNYHLNLSEIASSKMLCQNNADIVSQYQTALSKVMGYQVYEKTLKLVDQHGNVLLQYHTVP